MNSLLPFVATWIDLEDIMLSGISQTEKEKYCIRYLLYVESKKLQQISEYNNKKEADSQMQRTS